MNRPFRDGGTTAELPSAVDRGRRSDKAKMSDPVAAPLGTDVAVFGLPSHPEASTVVPAADLQQLRSETAPPPWSVRFAGAALAALAVYLLLIGLN